MCCKPKYQANKLHQFFCLSFLSLYFFWRNLLSQLLSFFLFFFLFSLRALSIRSELTCQTIPVVTRISLLIKTIPPDQSNSKYHARRRWFFSKNSWKKPISLSIRPVSSDLWKAPLVSAPQESVHCFFFFSENLRLLQYVRNLPRCRDFSRTWLRPNHPAAREEKPPVPKVVRPWVSEKKVEDKTGQQRRWKVGK